jgi:hypothetical protein
MFAAAARFGRMNRLRPCWAHPGTTPQVAAQLIREWVYLYWRRPKDGTCVYPIPPAPDTRCVQISSTYWPGSTAGSSFVVVALSA